MKTTGKGADHLSWRKALALNEEGIALLMVLWIITILMVVVLSFSVMTRTETAATVTFRDWAEQKFIAEAGIERGKIEIAYRRRNFSIEGKEVWKVDGTPYTDKIADGLYTVRIVDESGKVDINTASDIIMRNILMNLGIPQEQADMIVDSIMDWKDPDDLHRLSGAESDYYSSLPSPYKAKNAAFDTIEELLLIRGMTPDILYGTSGKRGVIDFFTVFSRLPGVNINAAPKEVLLAVPGMTPAVADAIIGRRQDKRITNPGEVDIPPESRPYLNTSDSNAFSIDATGQREKEKKGFSIRATVILEGNNKFRYAYYKSPVTITSHGGNDST